jgi:preprotein translocase subunit Sec61beta
MKKPDTRQAPQGMAGLVRYYDEDKSLLKLTPKQVIIMCGVLIVLEILFLALA